MDYILVIISVVLSALNFAVEKLYQKRSDGSVAASIKYIATLGITGSIIFFLISGISNGFSVMVTPFSCLMAFLQALLCLVYTVIGFEMIKSGSVANKTIFLMTGGMTLPYIWGIFALNEGFSVLRTIGLIFIIGGVVFANYQKGSVTLKYIIMGIAIFALNGGVSIVSKLHQIEDVRPVVASEGFVMLTHLSRGIMCVIILIALKLFGKRKSEEKEAQRCSLKTLIAIGSLSATVSGIAYLLQLIGAKTLPATVLYPLITGGTIIFTAISAAIFFKEKPQKQTLIGIALCFIGTCLFL